MKKIFTFIFALAMVAGVQAQTTVNPKVAAQKAAGLFQKTNAAKGMKATAAAEPKLVYVSVLNGDTCYYVFNNPEGGYAIIGGDLAARTVLAIVDAGSFDINSIPENMNYMIDEYAQSISAAKSAGITADAITAVGTQSYDAICKTTWNQQEPYWKNCVTITAKNAPKATSVDLNQHTLTGCVATAIAQCVKAMATKPALRGDISFKHDIVDANDNVLGAGTVPQSYSASKAIDWDNMIDSYKDNNWNDAQATAVADLMTIMGITCHMQYGRESGSTPELLWRGLVNNFGINCQLKDREGVADATWEKMIYDEIAAGRPVCYCGSSSAGGHAFLVDGYQVDKNLFHVNWGWGGDSDGYFALSSASDQKKGKDGGGSWLYPYQDEDSSGGSLNHYREGNAAIINLVYDASNLPAIVPEADASTTDVSESSGSKAKSMTTTDAGANTIPTIHCDKKLVMSFGTEGAKNTGAQSTFVWGVELTPVFADGQEPDEYNSYLLAVDKTGKTCETFDVGEVVNSYEIDLSEYDFAEEGVSYAEADANDQIALMNYTVTPCLFYDKDSDDNYEISDDEICYVGMPHGWTAPTVNIVAGSSTGINSVKTVTTSINGNGKYFSKDHGIIIVKHGKKFNTSGQQM